MDKKSIIWVLLTVAFLVAIFYGEPSKLLNEDEGVKRTGVNIQGVIHNNIGDTVKFYGADTTYIAALDSVTRIFSINFDLDSATFFNFFHGEESTRMHVKPNDNITLSLNTAEFDESITYSGSETSSALAWMYLEEENQDFPSIMDLSDEELDPAFEEYFATRKEKLEDFKESDPDFYASVSNDFDGLENYFRQKRTSMLALPKPGEDAFEISYPDKDSTIVNLSDFVGNVVYVDVWATWCGPCRIEIPHLVELENEYEEKDVTFIGVSLDVLEDKQTWLDMMEEKNMAGQQLITGGWTCQITNDYAITSIPRFMLFDKEGKVANLDAPRPSSDEIRPLLDGLLGE
ncbi:MAG: hypothetical protein CL823_07040 [Crocinitomicaceae bacterium]|nr:hypothetical protein [Crocinitomicaceae bacterium]